MRIITYTFQILFSTITLPIILLIFILVKLNIFYRYLVTNIVKNYGDFIVNFYSQNNNLVSTDLFDVSLKQTTKRKHNKKKDSIDNQSNERIVLND